MSESKEGSLATLSVALSCLAWKGRKEGRGKSSGRKGMAQRAEREGEEERGAGGLSTSRPPNKSEQVQGGIR